MKYEPSQQLTLHVGTHEFDPEHNLLTSATYKLQKRLLSLCIWMKATSQFLYFTLVLEKVTHFTLFFFGVSNFCIEQDWHKTQCDTKPHTYSLCVCLCVYK